MATTNLGRIGFVVKDTWSAGTYKNLDVVRYGNSSYACNNVAGTTGVPSVSADWTVIASDGLSIGSDAATLQTTGASVNVGASAPPVAKQILIATDATHAIWQDPPKSTPDFILINAGII